MRRLGFILTLAPLFAVAVGYEVARAYTLERVDNNPCGTARNLFWTSATARVDTKLLTPANFAQLASDAVAAWNSTLQRFRFTAATAASLCSTSDGIIALELRDTSCDGAALGPDVLGLASYRFNPSTGQFSDANIVFPPSGAFGLGWTDPVFLQTAIHELGHTLGLDHSDACGDSGQGTVMAAAMDIVHGPFFSLPQADDIAGGNAIYPQLPATSTPTPTSSPTVTFAPTSTRTACATPQPTPTPQATASATVTVSSTPVASATPTTALASTPSPTGTIAPLPCVGSCDGQPDVTIDGLIIAVNITLGVAQLSTCPSFDANGDDAVTIEELVQAVANSLSGCPLR